MTGKLEAYMQLLWGFAKVAAGAKCRRCLKMAFTESNSIDWCRGEWVVRGP